MDRSDVITLVKRTYIQDELLQDIPVESKRNVFCNVKSVGRQEWYDAGHEGLKPEYKVTMSRYEYDDEKIVVYQNKRYAVYRTYVDSSEFLELYIQQEVGA